MYKKNVKQQQCFNLVAAYNEYQRQVVYIQVFVPIF